MTGLGASVALAVLLGWSVFALAGLVLPPVAAAGIGLVLGAAVVFGFRDSMAVGGLIALLSPFGVMLPALALRHAAAKLGVPVVPFGTVELVVILAAYLLFLSAAFGVIPMDLYRFGYAPVPVAVMVLAVCAYGAATGNVFLPLVAVAGQAFWAMGWGSSNWFDYVLHAMLVPVAAVVLVGRFL